MSLSIITLIKYASYIVTGELARELHIKNDLFALVDADLYDELSQYRWYVQSHGYAARQVMRKSIYLHRCVNNTPDNLCTDVANGIRLDVRRCNLRSATNSQDKANMDKMSNNKTGYKGVFYVKEKDKYRAQITIHKEKLHLGYWNTAKEAARAYNEAAMRYYGEFAKINKL